MTEEAYLKMMGNPQMPPRIDPNNPEQVRKMREMVEKQSGGKKTIKTIGQTQGMGIYGDIDPAGYGYVVTETEKEKRAMSDPNSLEYKRRSARDDEARRREREGIMMQIKQQELNKFSGHRRRSGYNASTSDPSRRAFA